jgi:hypothetical protein
MHVAFSERIRNSGLAAQLRSSRQRRSLGTVQSAGSDAAKPGARLPLRSAIVWWAALSGIGWLLIVGAIRLVEHLLG